MIDDFDVISQWRPVSRGPSSASRSAAIRDFVRFLEESEPDVKPRRGVRPLIVALILGVLIAFGGVAAAVYGELQSDGVIFTSPEVTAAADRGLVIVVRESNLGTCIDVQVGGGGAGSCGSLDLPLKVGSGSVGESSFVSGYGPMGSVRIEIEFADGAEIVVDEFQSFDGYNVVFFAMRLSSELGLEPGLPVFSTAYGSSGESLATFSRGGLAGPDDE